MNVLRSVPPGSNRSASPRTASSRPAAAAPAPTARRQPVAGLDEGGVSMIELLVALLLFAVALLGLAGSFPLALVAVATGGYQTTATLLAQQCIELARSISYDPFGHSQLVASMTAACPDGAIPGHPGFTRAATVQPGAPTAQTTTVTIVVSLSGGSGGITDTTVSTILAR